MVMQELQKIGGKKWAPLFRLNLTVPQESKRAAFIWLEEDQREKVYPAIPSVCVHCATAHLSGPQTRR